MKTPIAISMKRVIRAGCASFLRNSFVSLTSVLTMVIALSFIVSIFLASALLTATLREIEKRVDINAYFVPEALEGDILALKERLLELPEVSEVTYVSRQQSLLSFRDRHKANAVILDALDELDDNPFGAILSIRAISPSHYESIARFVDSDAPSNLVS